MENSASIVNVSCDNKRHVTSIFCEAANREPYQNAVHHDSRPGAKTGSNKKPGIRMPFAKCDVLVFWEEFLRDVAQSLMPTNRARPSAYARATDRLYHTCLLNKWSKQVSMHSRPLTRSAPVLDVVPAVFLTLAQTPLRKQFLGRYIH